MNKIFALLMVAVSSTCVVNAMDESKLNWPTAPALNSNSIQGVFSSARVGSDSVVAFLDSNPKVSIEDIKNKDGKNLLDFIIEQNKTTHAQDAHPIDKNLGSQVSTLKQKIAQRFLRQAILDNDADRAQYVLQKAPQIRNEDAVFGEFLFKAVARGADNVFPVLLDGYKFSEGETIDKFRDKNGRTLLCLTVEIRDMLQEDQAAKQNFKILFAHNMIFEQLKTHKPDPAIQDNNGKAATDYGSGLQGQQTAHTATIVRKRRDNR